MKCPACDAEFFTNDDALQHVARNFFVPNERHRRLYVAVWQAENARTSGRFGRITQATTIGRSNAQRVIPGGDIPVLGSSWPDLTAVHWVEVLYHWVQANCQMGDRPPKDIILSAIADRKDLCEVVRPKLEDIEALHVKKALTKMAEGESA